MYINTYGGYLGLRWECVGHFPALASPCNIFHVHPRVGRWVAEEWGACSKSCGKLGVQARAVQCVQRLQNGTNRTLHTKYCPGQRPETRRPCSRLPCPAQWRTGAWSEVRSIPSRQGREEEGYRGREGRARWL